MTTFLIVFYLLLSIALFFVFKKAGEKSWKGLVPGLNFVVWSKLIGRESWWAALLLIPIVNIFIFAGMAVDMVRSFQKYQLWQSALAIIVTPFYFMYLGLSKKEIYDGPTREREAAYKAQIEDARVQNKPKLLKKLEDNNPYYKSPSREWVEAIFFAVFAAAFIRMFLIEAYMIPTSSMEGSLMVGDFLFVSKASYGIRTPKTIAMLPLLHNRVPLVGGESYFESPKLKPKRLPAIREIKRNSPVVFNFPAGDSVYYFPTRTWTVQDVRYNAVPANHARQIANGSSKLITRPVDKRDHYIKRCVGLPGDSLQIKNRKLYINGKPVESPDNLQYIYHVKAENGLNDDKFTVWGISEEDQFKSDPNSGSRLVILNEGQAGKLRDLDPSIVVAPTMDYVVTVPNGYPLNMLLSQYSIDEANLRGEISPGRLYISMTDDQASNLRKDTLLSVIQREINPERLFPHDPKHFPGWTIDNFGPIYIPKAGETVKISPSNIALYERIIDVYEGNDYEKKNGKIFINGKETTEYTFKMDYFWMMGDNRHNSEDSRVWGFVPMDHVVGRPLFIWFSLREGTLSKGINWGRIGLVGRHLK